MNAETLGIGTGYVSDGLVDLMALDQLERLGMSAGNPTLGVVLGSPRPDNVSYGMQLLRHGQKLTETGGLSPIELYIPTADGFDIARTPADLRAAQEQGLYSPSPDASHRHDDTVAGKIQDLNQQGNIAGILPLLPSVTAEGQQLIRKIIATSKDPDGVSPDRIVTPATPESQVALAEHILEKPISEVDPATIAIVGNGPLVGGPLYREVLPAHGVDIKRLGAAFATKDEIVQGLPTLGERNLKVIFTAVPVGALIRPEYVAEGSVIIDAGFGLNPETGEPSGNVHPALVALNGLTGTFTSFRRGVGPVTAAIIFDRTVPPRRDNGTTPPRGQLLATV